MKINNIGILKDKHLNDSTMIESLKKNGLECVCSDLARILGIEFDKATGYGPYYYDEISNSNNDKFVRFVNSVGVLELGNTRTKELGVRIAIPFNDIEGFKLSDIEKLEIDYPLFTMGSTFSIMASKLFDEKSKLILKTGRVHDILGEEYEEYELFGVKFIRIRSKKGDVQLTDGTIVQRDEWVYLAVDKIPLTVDPKANLIYSSVILFPARLDSRRIRDFNESELKNRLNDKFLKSINNELEHKNPTFLVEEEKYTNRYNFDFSELTEEEIMEICFKSRISVFLHGKVGTGKTERVVALDRNLELVDFGCTSSDAFTGIIAKDFSTNKLTLYQPYWYTSLCEKCEREPELLHILLLDELTNHKADIQKVAFGVVLDKRLVNGGFKLDLPDNAIVCAAGNETNDSKSASALSGPLFDRFAHIYIDTDSDEWLKWALTRKKEGRKLEYKGWSEDKEIHPAIIDYIRLRGDDALRTPYDGKSPNASPRKWVLASRALYECGNPNVLRAFIGKELTEDFIKFSKMNIITLDDVLNDKITPESLPSDDSSIIYFTVLCLSTVDDEHVDKVREFVGKLGKEFLAMFDYEWSKDNPERITRLYSNSHSETVKRLIR